MSDILEEYRSAADDLVEGILDSDNAAVEKAIGTRWACLERYAAEVKRWDAIPGDEKDSRLSDSVRRHHLCIEQADNDVIQRIESLKNEVGEAIVRVRKVGRMRRSYLPAIDGTERIIDGEG